MSCLCRKGRTKDEGSRRGAPACRREQRHGQEAARRRGNQPAALTSGSFRLEVTPRGEAELEPEGGAVHPETEWGYDRGSEGTAV